MPDTLSVSGICLTFFLTLYSMVSFADSRYLQALQQQAEVLRLSEKSQWQRLLHYQKGFIGDVNSLVADKKFFFHSQGINQPQAELKATLAHFFLKTGADKDSAQCRFPARFQWLKKQLKINNKHLPPRHCTDLKNWLDNLAVTGITLVFPIAYLNNPASMFGHSFLKLDKQQTGEGSELLAATVNYAAVTEKERGISFVIKGLFGGYQGKFSLAPYYVLLKEYGDLDNRDLWEYQLNFSEIEIQRLLLHLWELLPTEFDYYFINKNCSYQLLALLEAARPSLELSSQFNFDAIPADTVRAIIRQQGLLKKTRYRPALATVVTAKARLLDDKQKELAKALALEGLSLDAGIINRESKVQQAQILELAFDYLSYLNADKIKHHQAINGQLAYDLLAARSFLNVKILNIEINPPLGRPDEGHAGNRASFTYGYDGKKDYIEASYRWSYHDLYDPAIGFIKGGQVEFFKPTLRYYPRSNHLSFEALELININSKPQFSDFIRPFSWQVSLGAKRLRFADNKRHLAAVAKIGGGISYYPSANSLLSLNALTSLMFNNQFHQYTAIGFGAGLHFQYDPYPAWRIGLEADIFQYIQGITQTSTFFRLKQRFSLSNDYALIVDLNRSQEFAEAEFKVQIGLQIYF